MQIPRHLIGPILQLGSLRIGHWFSPPPPSFPCRIYIHTHTLYTTEAYTLGGGQKSMGVHVLVQYCILARLRYSVFRQPPNFPNRGLTRVDFFSIRHGPQVLFPFPVGHAAAARTDRGGSLFVCRQICTVAFRRGKRERALI